MMYGLFAYRPFATGVIAMSCQRGKPSLEPKPGRYKCKDCGVVRKKKDKLCEPKKIK